MRFSDLVLGFFGGGACSHSVVKSSRWPERWAVDLDVTLAEREGGGGEDRGMSWSEAGPGTFRLLDGGEVGPYCEDFARKMEARGVLGLELFG